MARYFMELAYKGTNYHGWQRQPNGISVQEVMESALSTILRIPVALTGAGRTDAGVHAAYMVAHFDLEQPLEDPTKLSSQLTRFLPADIVVFSVVPVNYDAHSRFDALSRRYEYHIIFQKNPFLQGLATRLQYMPDFDAMNQAADLLKQYNDFTSFSKLHTDVKTNICAVSLAQWERVGTQYVFVIEADRFLRNMVRAIVGTLLDVGCGKINVETFQEIIEKKDRSQAGTSAPAQGLYLVDVKYRDDVFKPQVSNKGSGIFR